MPPEANVAPAKGNSVPPHDITAEEAVLAAVMVSGSGHEVDQVASYLGADHFYAKANRLVFEACVALHKSGKPVDIVMVASALRANGTLESIGGMSFLTDIANRVPDVSRLDHYGRTVHGKWRLREAIKACASLAREGFAYAGDVQEFLDRAEATIHDVARSQTEVPFETVGEVSKRVLYKLQARAKSGHAIAGISTGFPGVDEKISGLGPGTLTVIAARPGVGKTVAALNMAMHIARDENHVAFFCAEMENDELATRTLASSGSVDQTHIYNAHGLTPREWSSLASAAKNLQSRNVHFCDDANINVFAIRAMCRRLRTKVEQNGGKLAAVFVDYLQLLESPDKKKPESREREVAQFSRSLKKLSKEMKIPVVALSQLNRQVESRSGGSTRPKLSDLRESGAIEQDANNVILVHREKQKPKPGTPYSATTQDQDDGEEVSEFIVAKARNGRPGVVPVHFEGRYCRFVEADEHGGYVNHDEGA